MKLFRYRKPSLKSALGITKIKRRIKKASGISTFERYAKPSRVKQSLKQKVGIYSPAMTVVRQTMKGNVPTPLGVGSKGGCGCVLAFFLIMTGIVSMFLG